MKKVLLSLILVVSLCVPVMAAIDLDGTDDFMTVSAYTGVGGTAARSTSFWFKSTDISGTDYLLGWGDNGTGAGEGFRCSHENGVIWGRYNTGVTANWGSGLNDGAWHHFTYSFPAGGANQDAVVYIDGSLETGTFGNGATALNTELDRVVTIGRFPGSDSGYYGGSISEVAIWSTNLTAAEQISLYNSRVKNFPLQIQSSSLQLYAPLNEVSDGASADGATLIDMASSRRDFTGDNGANNTGLTGEAEQVLSYP
jgi:hypothetical protein